MHPRTFPQRHGNPLSERRLCRMEAPDPRPVEVPELETRPEDPPRRAAEIEERLSVRRVQRFRELCRKPTEELRRELATLTRQAADVRRTHMTAYLAAREKRDGDASPSARLKADFLLLLVQDHCRVLYAKTDPAKRTIDPAIDEAVSTLSALGVTLILTPGETDLTVREMRTTSRLQQDLHEYAVELRRVRKAIAQAGPGADMSAQRAREEELTTILRNNRLPVTEAALPGLIDDLGLSARYLDARGGTREPPAQPQLRPLEAQPEPDRRTTEKIRESLRLSATALAKARREYMTSHVARMDADPDKRPLNADILQRAIYNDAEEKGMRRLIDDARELVRRYNAAEPAERDAHLKAYRDVAEEARRMLSLLGHDLQLLVRGTPPNAEFDRISNVYDESYMNRFVPAMERLMEVRRLRASGDGDDAALRKEEADLVSWADSLGYPIGNAEIADTLSRLRLTRDFYRREPTRAAEASWGKVARKMSENADPDPRDIAELNWAVNAMYYLPPREGELRRGPADRAEEMVDRVETECLRMGFRVVRESAATQEERDGPDAHRVYKLTFRRIILTDERNEAEEMLRDAVARRAAYQRDVDLGVGPGRDFRRAFNGRNKAKKEIEELQAFLNARKAAGELPPERVVSHRMHAAAEFLTSTWIHKDEPAVKEKLDEVSALSEALLTTGGKGAEAFLERQLAAVNAKLLEFGLEMSIKDGLRDNRPIRFVVLQDVVKRAVRTRMNRAIDAAEGDAKADLLAARERYERRQKDLELMDRFLAAGVAHLEADQDEPDRATKAEDAAAARKAVIDRIESIAEYADRSRFIVRLHCEARRKGYELFYQQGLLTLEREETPRNER